MINQYDPLLSGLLSAKTDAQANHETERLIRLQSPLVRRLIALHVGRDRGAPSSDTADHDDIYGAVMARIIVRLRRYQADPTGAPIRDLTSYVGATAINMCHDFLSAKKPHWGLVRGRLRSLVKRTPGLTLDYTETGAAVCLFEEWRGRRPARYDNPRLAEMRDHPESFAEKALAGKDADNFSPRALLIAILKWIGEPVELNALVAPTAILWGVDSISLSSDGHFESSSEASSTSASITHRMLAHDQLRMLWSEIRKLAPAQRAALLLNMCDATGQVGVDIFPSCGIATVGDIADCVGVEEREFRRLWGDMPLPDADISVRLGVTPRQVINLRKTARERLSRRLRAYEQTSISAR